MTQRKSYKIKAGNINNLRISEENLSDPQDHEVQIEVRSIGLNFADLYAIWGLYSATPKHEFVPGLEYAGIVLAAGRNSPFVKGQPVMGITRFGAYSTHLNIDARYVVPLPDAWTFDQGAAYLVQAMTAYYALVTLGNLQPGYKVLIHSGAGGVGLYANRIAKNMGAYTIGTTGHSPKLNIMLKEGYDACIVRSRFFFKEVSEIVPGGQLDLILECIGGQILRQGFELLAPEGRMVVYGSAHFTTQTDRPNYIKLLFNYLRRPKIDPLQLPNTNRSVMGFNLIWLYDQVNKMHQMIEELETSALPSPTVGQTFDFKDLPQAVRKLRSGKTSGKVVVQVSEP